MICSYTKSQLLCIPCRFDKSSGPTVSQTFKIPDALVGAKTVQYVAVHDTNPYAAELAEAEYALKHLDDGIYPQNDYNEIKALYDKWEEENVSGAEFGTVTLSLDGLTLTATHTGVKGFSPFIVYAFVEADEPEYKTFVTQEDGALALVTDDLPVTHTVAQGENLTDIARKYGCTVEEIVALNSDLIENPSLIRTGWELYVPAE